MTIPTCSRENDLVKAIIRRVRKEMGPESDKAMSDGKFCAKCVHWASVAIRGWAGAGICDHYKVLAPWHERCPSEFELDPYFEEEEKDEGVPVEPNIHSTGEGKEGEETGLCGTSPQK